MKNILSIIQNALPNNEIWESNSYYNVAISGEIEKTIANLPTWIKKRVFVENSPKDTVLKIRKRA